MIDQAELSQRNPAYYEKMKDYPLWQLNWAKRPVIIYGAGIHIAGAESEAREFARLLNCPVAPTWAALDILPYTDPLFIGAFGTHGTRYGNFPVQNADWILSVGSRLDSKATGTPPSGFARGAKIFMVDIDQTEIDKFQHMDVKVTGICMDAEQFLREEINRIRARLAYEPGEGSLPDFSEWRERIADWRRRYPICPPEYHQEQGVNPYVLVKALSAIAKDGDIICSDTGCAVAWMAQAFEFKQGQRFIHAWNQTPMGYGLPSAIGAHYASGRRIILVSGDGSLMMSVGELATIGGRNLPIKIIVMNNQGHAMCRQTQREWFGNKYESTSIEGGLRFPDFLTLANACGMKAQSFKRTRDLHDCLDLLFSDDKPQLLEVMLEPEHDVKPKLFATKPLEDMQPYLDRDEFKAQMMVPLWGS